MERSIEISGDWLARFFYAFSLAGLAVILWFVVRPFEEPANLPLAAMLGVLGVATMVGLWRRETGRDEISFGQPGDITYDPYAYPGHAAKDYWQKSIQRLQDDDEQD